MVFVSRKIKKKIIELAEQYQISKIEMAMYIMGVIFGTVHGIIELERNVNFTDMMNEKNMIIENVKAWVSTKPGYTALMHANLKILIGDLKSSEVSQAIAKHCNITETKAIYLTEGIYEGILIACYYSDYKFSDEEKKQKVKEIVQPVENFLNHISGGINLIIIDCQELQQKFQSA